MIGSLNLSQTQWARNVVQVSAAVCGEERCVTRQITAAWETSKPHDFAECVRPQTQSFDWCRWNRYLSTTCQHALWHLPKEITVSSIPYLRESQDSYCRYFSVLANRYNLDLPVYSFSRIHKTSPKKCAPGYHGSRISAVMT